MAEIVQVPRSAFTFCRWSLTGLLWAAFLLRQTWMVPLVLVLLGLSALLKVHRSPMILLWSWTTLRLSPPIHYEFMDVAAMRFAHGAGTLMALGVLLALLVVPHGGRMALLAFCCLKSVSALGFCPASKLFVCLRKGGCCALTRVKC